MKKLVRSLSGTLFALLCLPQFVGAQTPAATGGSGKPTVGVAVKASSLGIGFDVAVRVHDKVNLRGNGNFFSLSHSFDTSDNITYNGELKLRSFAAYVDYFPFGGGFHLSPVLVFGDKSKVTLSSLTPGGQTIDIDDTEYQSSGANPIRSSGDISFKSTKPGIVIGWGNIAGRHRFRVPVELGVLFAGAPVGRLSFTGTACQPNGQNCRDVATDAGIQADVRAAEQSLNDDIKFFRFYPVVSLGFSFRF